MEDTLVSKESDGSKQFAISAPRPIYMTSSTVNENRAVFVEPKTPSFNRESLAIHMCGSSPSFVQLTDGNSHALVEDLGSRFFFTPRGKRNVLPVRPIDNPYWQNCTVRSMDF